MQQTAIYNEQMASMQGSNRPLAAEQPGERATATARLPVRYNPETGRVDNAGYDCATITFYWNAAEQHLTKFVEENPILAAIVTVAFAILGLSFLVPSFIAGIIIGVPLVALAALLGKTIYDHKDIFLHNFLHQVRGEQLRKTMKVKVLRYLLTVRIHNSEGTERLLASPLILTTIQTASNPLYI